MSEHVYKIIEVCGSSPEGIDQAITNAVDRAGKTVRNMRWFELSEVRGHIDNNKIAHWQATVKIGFSLEE